MEKSGKNTVTVVSGPSPCGPAAVYAQGRIRKLAVYAVCAPGTAGRRRNLSCQAVTEYRRKKNGNYQSGSAVSVRRTGRPVAGSI